MLAFRLQDISVVNRFIVGIDADLTASPPAWQNSVEKREREMDGLIVGEEPAS